MRTAALMLLLVSPAFADDPDGPDDARVAPPTQPQPQEQPPPPPPLPPPPPQVQAAPFGEEPSLTREQIQRLESSGKAMKGGGAFMIALGAALELTGLVMTFYSQLAPAPVCTVVIATGVETCPDDPRIPYLIAGTVGDLAGGGLIGGGLALLSAGNSRIRRARVLKLHMSFGAQQVSAQVGMSF